MLVPVPARIGGGVGEPEVGREVDDPDRRQDLEDLLDDLLGGNTWRISCPARRSAVSSASSTLGWRIRSRTSSAPV
jgi:hypothetical protein